MNHPILTISSSNQIGKIRKLRNLSRKRMASSLGQKTTSQICLWEQGRKLPSLRNALKLALILDTSVEQLFRQLILDLEKNLPAKTPNSYE